MPKSTCTISFYRNDLHQTKLSWGILCHAGLPDMKKSFGDRPEDFYFENDMHLNEEGLRIFSQGLASFLATNEVI